MEFSELVKQIRKQLNMSQMEFAEALSVNFSTVNRWKNGHVKPSKLAKASFYRFCEDRGIDMYSIGKNPDA
jgi:DNA-binding transcriptional regulator YiaG